MMCEIPHIHDNCFHKNCKNHQVYLWIKANVEQEYQQVKGSDPSKQNYYWRRFHCIVLGNKETINCKYSAGRRYLSNCKCKPGC